MIIAVAIKSYLKDYLIAEYGCEPVPASKKNIVGLLIEPMLKKPPADLILNTHKSAPDMLLINILWQKRECGMTKDPMYYWHLDKDDINRFQRSVMELFWQTCYSYLDAKMEDRLEIKESVYNFCEKYKLNHANYELIKKSYYRYRTAKIRNNCCGTVPCKN